MGRADRAFLTRHLRPEMTVVDIGANQGLYALLFSQQVSAGGRVLAFEPDPMLYDALRKNVTDNKAYNVVTFHCALGSKAGAMTLHRSLLNSGDNRLASHGRENNLREAVQVRVETLDDALAGQRIDLIKMDVQGWEMEVFRGMERLLDEPRNENLTVFFEYWPGGLMEAGSDPTEPLSFLLEKRFRLFQTAGTAAGEIVDVEAFVRSVPRGAYLNLYAARSRTAEGQHQEHGSIESPFLL